MAKTGLKGFLYSAATEATDATPVYSGTTKPGKAISFSFEPNVSDAKLYADDAIAESDSGVNGGTLTMGIDRYQLPVIAELLGHTIDEETGVMTSNVNDAAPVCGFGRSVVVMQDGVRKVRAVFFYRVKFQEPSADETTKGETTEFGTYELQGTVMPTAEGNWREEKYFDTEAEANTWLQGLMAAPTTQNNG